MGGDFPCSGGNNACIIDRETRTNCRRCRYRRCLDKVKMIMIMMMMMKQMMIMMMVT